MKKLCFILLLSAFFSNTSMAKDSCQSHLENLENRLEKCTISYSENASTADMNKATYDAADCAIQIANELFDTYYMTTKEESKACSCARTLQENNKTTGNKDFFNNKFCFSLKID